MSTARIRPGTDNPDFMAWVAMQPALVEEFITFDVPNLPADEFSAAGLDAAASHLLAQFDSPQAAYDAPDGNGILDRHARFLGEVFIRAFNGRWVLDADPKAIEPLVGFDPPLLPIDPFGLVITALERREPTLWSEVFGYHAEDFAAEQR